MIGQDIAEVIERLNFNSLKNLVGKDIVEALRDLKNEDLLRGLRKVAQHLICSYPKKYFSDSEIRSSFYNAMPRKGIEDLAKRLQLENVESVFLLDPSTDNRTFARYLGFFGINIHSSNSYIVESENEKVSVEFGLFSHQRQTADKIWRALGDGHGRIVLHMPTGSGKTRTAMHFVCRYLNAIEPGVVVWLANSRELLDQAAEAFQNAWPKLGARDVQLFKMWGTNEPNLAYLKDGVIVAGLQKMYSFSNREPGEFLRLASHVKLVVVDEAHQSIAPTYQEVIQKLSEIGSHNALLGLTATPGRTWSDVTADKKLSSFFHGKKVMLEIPGWDNPITYLIKEGYLAKPTFRTFNHHREYQLSELSIPAGKSIEDYSPEILSELASDTSRNSIIINEIKNLITEGHKRIIVFASSVRHAEILTAILSVINIDARLVTGETSPTNRRRTIDSFRIQSNQPMIINNFGVLTTGFDAPITSAAIIARPTLSLVLFSQMVGRAIRGVKAGGNRECTISTIVDTALPGFGDIAEAFTNWEDVWSE